MYSAYILTFLFSYVHFCYISVTFPYCSMILGICLVCIQSIQPWTRSFEVARPDFLAYELLMIDFHLGSFQSASISRSEFLRAACYFKWPGNYRQISVKHLVFFSHFH